jgi:hypothetical protein
MKKVSLSLRIELPNGSRRYVKPHPKKSRCTTDGVYHEEAVYVARFTSDGKQRWETVGRELEVALHRQKAKEALLFLGLNPQPGKVVEKAPAPSEGTLLLETAILKYLAHITAMRSEKTADGYAYTLNQFKASYSKRYLKDVKKQDLYDFIAAMKKTGELTDRTISNRIGEVVTFLRHFDIKDVSVRHKYTEKEVIAYKEDELKALFAACTESPLNAAAAIAVELEKVQATVYPQFQQDCLIYNRLQNLNNFKVSDRLTRIPLLAQPGSTFSQFDPDGVSDSMGLGGAEQYIVGVTSIVYFCQSVQVTKRAEWATDGSVKAVTDIYKDSFKINLKQFRSNLESLLCFSDGSGVIGTLMATPPSSTQQDFLQVNNSNSFQAGATYQVFSAGYVSNRGNIVVASVDSANNIIYLVQGGAGGRAHAEDEESDRQVPVAGDFLEHCAKVHSAFFRRKRRTDLTSASMRG